MQNANKLARILEKELVKLPTVEQEKRIQSAEKRVQKPSKRWELWKRRKESQ